MYLAAEVVTPMKFSSQVQAAVDGCFSVADSVEVIELLDAEVHAEYHDLVDVDDPSGAFLAGAAVEAAARMQGLHAFCTAYDGNGVWTFAGKSEEHVVAALDHVAAVLTAR
jgi:hypothetical protein